MRHERNEWPDEWETATREELDAAEEIAKSVDVQVPRGCVRCGFAFVSTDDEPLCGICRIELRNPMTKERTERAIESHNRWVESRSALEHRKDVDV